MSITDEITRLQNAKSDMKQALESHGVQVGNSKLDQFASLISSILSGGASLPGGIKAVDFGTITISTQFTTARQTFNHNLQTTPDFIMVWAPANVNQTYSMLCAIRSSQFGWRSSAYDNHMCYHGNSSTTATWVNSNSASYGISNMTENTFQLASSSSSYYWRTGTYNYIAIKFN